MSGYTKVLVDNPVCSRRFHLSYDAEGPLLAKAHVECPFCGVTIFEEKNHPAVKLARQENLTKTTALSQTQVFQCDLEDKLSRETLPPDLVQGKDFRVYPKP